MNKNDLPWVASGSKGCTQRGRPCARWSCYCRMPGSRPRNPPRPSGDGMSWGCSSGSRSTWVSTVARRSTRTKRPPWRPSPRDPRPRAPEVLSCSLWHPSGTPSLHPLVAFHHAPLYLPGPLVFPVQPALWTPRPPRNSLRPNDVSSQIRDLSDVKRSYSFHHDFFPPDYWFLPVSYRRDLNERLW